MGSYIHQAERLLFGESLLKPFEIEHDVRVEDLSVFLSRHGNPGWVLSFHLQS